MSFKKAILILSVINSVFCDKFRTTVSPIGHGLQRIKQFNSRQIAHYSSCENTVQYYFKDAVIDNFSPINEQVKWESNGQRYWINEEFWGGKGYPIFVYIGGEGAQSCSSISSNRLYIYELAEQHSALLVNIEHRFYGESYPTTDMSTKNLSYLSADQALADLARLITYIQTSYSSSASKVITFGGSYPGNLAAWFRLKYPSISFGSIASSAPLTAKVNFYEYMEVVGQSILYFSGQKCYDAFAQAAIEVARLANDNNGGLKQLEKDFETCSPIQNSLDLGVLYSDLMGNVQGTVQYNNEITGGMNVTDICDIMTASENSYDQFVKLSAAYRSYYGYSCEDANWNDLIEYIGANEMDTSNAYRPWTYQTCNEFGYYQTTDSPFQPFYAWKELNVNFSRAICAAAFDGWTSDPQVDWINANYGNVNIAATNVVFPSGTIDPWHALGITNSTPTLPQSTEVPNFILGTAHCKDMYSPASSDPSSLTYAREIISSNIELWLS